MQQACRYFAIFLSLAFASAQAPLSSINGGNALRGGSADTGIDDPTTARLPLSYETRGDIYMARKMYREAIDMYRQGPANSAVLANKIGIGFHQMMKLPLAMKNYERAIKLDPKYPEPVNNLGTIYYCLKDFNRAIKFYKRALRQDPHSASVFSNLGAAYFGKKQYKLATAAYQRALQLDPDILESHSNYGTLMLERTVEDRANFDLYMAEMYIRLGERARVLLYLRKAMEEGIKKQKIMGMAEFAGLKADSAFIELLAENPKPL